MPATTPHDRTLAVKAFALELGFDLVGIAPPAQTAHAAAYRAWIEAGKHGEMTYLARNVENRLDLSTKWPWAKSIICVALAYFQQPPEKADDSHDQRNEPTGKIARYAWGRDYHRVIEKKLTQLERLMRRAFEPEIAAGGKLEIRPYCDTGPILERELAARAGLGWTGKHTLLIHPRHGSWFVLGELITNLELDSDSAVDDHCGTCTRCVEACPTAAISPYSVDATRCISYLTLEHRQDLNPTLQKPMRDAGFLIGCDICQEVCPFNRQPLPTREADFTPRPPAPEIPLQHVLAWQEHDWDVLTRGRASRRAKFPMWQRTSRTLSQTRINDLTI